MLVNCKNKKNFLFHSHKHKWSKKISQFVEGRSADTKGSKIIVLMLNIWYWKMSLY